MGNGKIRTIIWLRNRERTVAGGRSINNRVRKDESAAKSDILLYESERNTYIYIHGGVCPLFIRAAVGRN